MSVRLDTDNYVIMILPAWFWKVVCVCVRAFVLCLQQCSQERKLSSDVEEFVDIKRQVRGLSDRYEQLRTSTDDVAGRLRRAHDAHQELKSASELLTAWIEEATVDDCPVSGLDMAALQQALQRTKLITAESSMQKKMLDKLRAAAETLKSLGADDGSLTAMVESVGAKFAQITESAGERCNELQVAIVRSQGVSKGVDGLLGWVHDAEASLRSLVRPVRLDTNSVTARMTEAASLHTDITSRASSLEEIQRSTSIESDSSEVDAKLRDLNLRYEQLSAACHERQTQLADLSAQLTQFHSAVKQFDSWLLPTFSVLDSRDVLTEARLKEIADDIKLHQTEVDSVRQLASEMMSNPVVGDADQVHDAVNEMDRALDDVSRALGAREEEGELRDQQLGRFDELRSAVEGWLSDKEHETETFAPVAVGVDLLNTQMEQLKVCQNHYLFAVTSGLDY